MTRPTLDTDRPRIALVRLSSLGDVVRVLPLLASLRRRWPDCELTWAVEPGPRALLGDHPLVDRFLVLRRDRPLTGHLGLWARTRGLSFDAVLDLHRYFKAGLVTAMLRAPVKVGFDRERSADLNWWLTTHHLPPAPRRHVQEEYFEFLRWLDVPVVRAWPLPLTDEERRRRDAFFSDLEEETLGVLLCSSTDVKDWPAERWARALEAVRDELGLQPVLVGGRNEREERRAARLKELTRVPVVDGREQDLRRLLWMVDGCTVFAGPDSGPLHIAAAAGTPAVGLYGPTDPTRHGPWGPRGRGEELVVDRFGPREGNEPTDETRPGRMERITVEEVVRAIGRAREVAAAGPPPEASEEPGAPPGTGAGAGGAGR